MGASLKKLVDFFDQQYIDAREARVLDIGSQNLYLADKDSAKGFIRRYNDIYEETELDAYAQMLADGSLIDPACGGINGAWVGDLLSRAGMEYLAFDIFEGFGTVLFDLNHEKVDPSIRGSFDIVFNLGTTEHLLGQLNAFEVIHDACRTGGVMFHDLPMHGFIDHGYFSYHPLLFRDLAAANGYELLGLSTSAPGADESVAERTIEQHRHLMAGGDALAAAWRDRPVPTASLTVALRKTKDEPFRVSLETRTTAGPVAARIARSRGASATTADAESEQGLEDLRTAVHKRLDDMLQRLPGKSLQFSEIMALYNDYLAASLTRPFPLSLEAYSLDLVLAEDPGRDDLRARREEVATLFRSRHPLMKYATEAAGSAPAISLDGVEAEFPLTGDETLDIAVILAAYAAYGNGRAVELFPRRLEYAALKRLIADHPDDSDLKVRLGTVLSDLTRGTVLSKR